MTEMTVKKKRKKPRLLSNTRPPVIGERPSLSSQATRSVIRNHHTLQKQLHTAVSEGDNAKVASIQAQLAASGGLQKYQAASIQGQSAERGGDTSKVLMEWMHEILSSDSGYAKNNGKPRLLEIGALKVDNACSRSGIFDMTRIDLHSQHPEIQTQDFMKMSSPSKESLEIAGFDIVSLSLVVNYVGDAVVRGDMLKRVANFLRFPSHLLDQESATIDPAFPSLFLVLPAPCVTNSRYLDEDRLEAIMTTLGYVKLKGRISKKLVYYLWRYKGIKDEHEQAMLFKKQEVRSGNKRNNFTIILQ